MEGEEEGTDESDGAGGAGGDAEVVLSAVGVEDVSQAVASTPLSTLTRDQTASDGEVPQDARKDN